MDDADVTAADAMLAKGVPNVFARPESLTRTAAVDDAPLVHALYRATPRYFDIISIPVPTLEEVRTDLATAARDDRRHMELVTLPERPDLSEGDAIQDSVGGGWVVGYLDYKTDYPEAGDATVNLLLVHGSLQDRGIGRLVVRDLERRLRGSAKRVLASIYGRNPGARRFWEGLGYTFAFDARPILDWYSKSLV